MLKQCFTGSLLTIALSAVAQPAYGANILFTFVQDDYSHVDSGRELASYLDLMPDFTVTQRVLDDAIYYD